MINHPIEDWLWLFLTPGLSNLTALRLSQEFGSPSALRQNLDHPSLQRLKPNTLQALKRPDLKKIEAHLHWQTQSQHALIAISDDQYPPTLAEIHDPPILLCVKGNPEHLSAPQLAVVGSRKMTPYGQDLAYYFSKSISEAGLVITSGLAAGIDSKAHRGALDAGGTTLAVLGTGIDQIYPAQHKSLAEEIQNQGCLISCFPLGTSPDRFTFPKRNRIITGLSIGTLVIEASLKSGSLLSARLAMEQGREVFAIPGPIHHTNSQGCHALIQQGAKLVQSTLDILEELRHLLPKPEAIASSIGNPSPPDKPTNLNSAQEKMLNLLQQEGPLCFDDILELSELPYPEVSSGLLDLELLSYIQQDEQGYRCAIKTL